MLCLPGVNPTASSYSYLIRAIRFGGGQDRGVLGPDPRAQPGGVDDRPFFDEMYPTAARHILAAYQALRRDGEGR